MKRALSSVPLLLCCLLLTMVSAPADAKSDFDRYLTGARRLYESLEYERALAQIRRAQQLTETVNQDVATSILEGLILADMGKQEQSQAAFKAALLLDPDAKILFAVSPKVMRSFETVRALVRKELAKNPPPETEPPPSPDPATSPPAPSPAPSPAAATTPVQPEPQGTPTVFPVASTGSSDVTLTPSGSSTPEAELSGRRGKRLNALIPAITGGVLLVSSGVLMGLAKSEQRKLRDGAPELATREDAHRTASLGRTYQTVGFSLAGAGIVGLGVAVGMYALGGAESSVAIGLGTDGRSAVVHGRWP